MANVVPSLHEEAPAAAVASTTQLLERAILLLLFGGLILGVVAVLRPFATAILFGLWASLVLHGLSKFLDRLTEALVARHVEQFVHDLFERRLINVLSDD